jgi:hypothetical protein
MMYLYKKGWGGFPREKKQLKTIVLFLYVSNVVIENLDSGTRDKTIRIKILF